jgi:AcrR family transcriptional regulator
MKRQAKGAAREQQIIEAAAATIAERGLADVRVADIAERADISVGHLTYYFPSKASLLIRAIQLSEAELHQRASDALEQIRDPWRRLERLVELAAANGRGDPGWVLWFEVWANAARNEEVAQVQSQLDARWRETLTDVIRYGCDQGGFVTDDPAEVSTLLSSLIDGLSVHVALGDPQVDVPVLKQLCRRAAEALLLA